MTITTTQKIIKIGTSKGVTIPAKDLRMLNAEVGDELEITVRKTSSIAADGDVQAIAKSLLERYDQDFKNLANR